MKLQCKDVEEKPILEFLFLHKNTPCSIFEPQYAERSVHLAFPKDIPFNLLRGKMSQMIRKGFVDGCCCGCRGDFEITKKGISKLEDLKDK